MALPAFSTYAVNWLLLETNKNIDIVFLNESWNVVHTIAFRHCKFKLVCKMHTKEPQRERASSNAVHRYMKVYEARE